MYSDSRRYVHSSQPTIFPHPSNYTNLDNFLHDIRMAIRDEKAFRREHHLTSTPARIEYALCQQANFQFDVI